MSRPDDPETAEPDNADAEYTDAKKVDSEDATSEDAVVDARGLRCPLPVIRLARLVSDSPGVREVSVLATDPAAGHDIPAWCRMRGHLYIGAHDGDGHTVYRVRVRPIRPAAES